MHFSDVFFDILVILAASVLVVLIFKRVKTSAILGYLAVGAVLGPAGLAIIEQSEGLNMLAEFGVVFLLFMIGLEFSVARLKALLKYVVGLGGLQVTLTAALVTLVVTGFAIAPGPAVIIGGGLALSSTAFVLQLLSERGERDTPHGRIALAILLFQDLAIVPLLILLTVLADSQGGFWSALGIAIGEAAIALGVVYFLGRLLFRPIYRAIAQADELDLFVATTLLLIFGIGWFLSLFGVSMALSGFLAGLLLAETEFRHQVEADIKPFKGMALGLFFMTVGMTIDVTLLIEEGFFILMLVFGLLLGKTILIAVLTRAFGMSIGVSLRSGLLLAQGGEFGFVLFISAGSLGLLTLEQVQLLLTCIALSMATTPLLASLGKYLHASLQDRFNRKESLQDVRPENASDHAIIIGFGRVGQTVAMLMKEMGLRSVALDLDIERVQKSGGSADGIYYGDARQISVLHSMGIDKAKCVVITIDETLAASQIIHAVEQVAPTAKVFVRARDVQHVRFLEESENVRAVPEAVEGSLQLGAIVLQEFGIEDITANDAINAHRDSLYHHLAVYGADEK